MPNPPLSDTNLTEIFTSIQTSSELLHDFTKGDSDTIVEGADGAYPSLAKIAADSQEALGVNQAVLAASQNAIANLLHQASGVVAKTFAFNSTLSLVIQHDMNTKFFTKTIVNSHGDEVFAPASAVDANQFVVEFTEAESGFISVLFYLNTSM